MMKKIVLTTLLILPATGLFAADQQGLDMMAVLTALEQANYHYIKDIEQRNAGVFYVEALDSQGKKMDFTVKQLSDIKPLSAKAVHFLTSKEIGEHVLHEGYLELLEVKNKGDHFDVKARDRRNKTINLRVNAVTGEVNVQTF